MRVSGFNASVLPDGNKSHFKPAEILSFSFCFLVFRSAGLKFKVLLCSVHTSLLTKNPELYLVVVICEFHTLCWTFSEASLHMIKLSLKDK